jgi:hypothetical protein
MRFSLPSRAAAGFAALFLAGCATAYEWGAVEDREWSSRVGHVNLSQVTQALGQPVEKLSLPSGDMKVRWYARPLLLNEGHGTMEDQSLQRTEVRAYWRDMRFNRAGVLTRAWLSDQRSLANSEAP